MFAIPAGQVARIRVVWWVVLARDAIRVQLLGVLFLSKANHGVQFDRGRVCIDCRFEARVDHLKIKCLRDRVATTVPVILDLAGESEFVLAYVGEVSRLDCNLTPTQSVKCARVACNECWREGKRELLSVVACGAERVLFGVET